MAGEGSAKDQSPATLPASPAAEQSAVPAASSPVTSLPNARQTRIEQARTGQTEQAGTDQTDAAKGEDAAAVQRGYHNLRQRAYLPPDFDADTFSQLWTLWPEPARTLASESDEVTRHRLIRQQYGLPPDPEHPEATGPGLAYVPRGDGSFAMNCMACHSNVVAGKIIPGAPNSLFALQSLVEDTRLLKLTRGRRLSHLDLAALKLPLGTTNGTTNAVIFGVILEAVRDQHMKFDPSRPIPPLLHHDMDAPPLWNVKRKSSLYCDGFAPKNHRMLMQFILVKQNSAEQVRKWEPEFRDLLAWIESLEPPRYPFPVDEDLAATGAEVFQAHCSRCHGSYGEGGSYRQQTIPLEVVGTDPVRLNSLSQPHREWVSGSWMSRYGQDAVDTDPGGYIAPPLNGLWATAPYLHNGSVPTLWHLLHPDQRPVVWERPAGDAGRVEDYDPARVGPKVVEHDNLPERTLIPREQRRFFDTRRRGKSAAGHTFPAELTEPEKQAVLEYLKTL
ncbi:MAG: c-type cytochrome [Planctomycetaceae bacterium]|nr:c-type cytochrome [Planctomycetaceae bacterium]